MRHTKQSGKRWRDGNAIGLVAKVIIIFVRSNYLLCRMKLEG